MLLRRSDNLAPNHHTAGSTEWSRAAHGVLIEDVALVDEAAAKVVAVARQHRPWLLAVAWPAALHAPAALPLAVSTRPATTFARMRRQKQEHMCSKSSAAPQPEAASDMRERQMGCQEAPCTMTVCHPREWPRAHLPPWNSRYPFCALCSSFLPSPVSGFMLGKWHWCSYSSSAASCRPGL